MRYAKYNNYDPSPSMRVEGYDDQAFSGYEEIKTEIAACIEQGKRIFVFDFYPGVDKEEVLGQLADFSPALLLDAESCALEEEELTALFSENLTEDRVFGLMTHKKLEDCFSQEKLEAARATMAAEPGLIFIVGTGAGLVSMGDVYFYFDLARWEIQLRYRSGMPNWRCSNGTDPILTKYKQGFFVEWRIADRYKKHRFDKMDYIVDTNEAGNPGMITGTAFRSALRMAAARPFRVKPYFDPGVWGGQWMKEVFGLSQEGDNLAWSFDGVPEENSLQFTFGEMKIELPCIDLVLYQPEKLLGERVHARFGAEFPIRFDLLDTMDGGNLSLQVHPLTEYIQEHFGMHYTQDESYYILDAKGDDPCVYLGVKEGVRPEEMAADLRDAQEGKQLFDTEKYVNKIPVKKHDHVLIPAGTVHCSGKDTMVLEISATPYIFTFKLWDWGRIGLDGKPRPIHIEHGLKNIQWNRDLAWVKENLIHQERILKKEEGLQIERTGLHEREFIDTHRYTFSREVTCSCDGSVHVLNLVEGAQVTIKSINGEFSPFTVHYAETFIIPAEVKRFVMVPDGPSEGKTVAVIDAKVR